MGDNRNALLIFFIRSLLRFRALWGAWGKTFFQSIPASHRCQRGWMKENVYYRGETVSRVRITTRKVGGGEAPRKLANDAEARAIETEVADDEARHALRVVEAELGKRGLERLVGGHRDHVRIVRVQQRRRGRAPVDFDLGDVGGLVALDDHQVAWRQVLEELAKRRLRGAPQ